ncbi:osteoclast-associated immunoglobulin-like receptor [Cebus imitator]|uniref:osteoclast-associated immunoglobulin-like receptor n=1 Tax=Cebus imitator TaxID=2715852 RepID=UPI001898D6E9|nr:osteoclast-associated immunoglobulin-like receptor [Cebus imitator]
MALVLILQLLTLCELPFPPPWVPVWGGGQRERRGTEAEKGAITVQGDFPLSPTSLSSSGAPRRSKDSGSPVYSVPPVSYPKPWLGARPATVVTPRVNVTLRCRAPQPAWRFALFKSGETDPLLLREVSSELAEFFLEEVTPAQGGSYHCCYGKPDWAPSVWSQPSDALELLVTGEVLGSRRRRGWNKGGREGQRDTGKEIQNEPDSHRLLPQTHELKPPSTLPQLSDWGVRTLSPPQRQETWSSGPRLLGPSADSPSPPARPADSSSSDYTRENLVRLGLAGLVLISLGVLVAFDCRSQNHAPAGVRP